MSTVFKTTTTTTANTTETLDHRPRYRPDIDGLRAIAVLVVVLCHARFTGFSGGFVGVDVFFVISGFVVASSIARELDAGTFSFGRFYIRRARRLAPALFLMLASVLAFSILFRAPSDAYEVAKAIGYNALLASNIYLSKGWSYFAPQAEDQPLLHTWSLSVEEQFYLVFPLVLRFLLGRDRATARAAFALLLVASVVVSEIHVRHASAGSYYLFQNRAFELLIGVLLALAPVGTRNGARDGARKWVLDAAFLGGIALLSWCVWSFDGKTPFPGWHALLPCAAAAVIIASGEHAWLARGLLANKVARGIGKLSYSIYLWHWPIFFALHTFGLTKPVHYAVGIVVSFCLSGLSYVLVEKPLRFAPMSKRHSVMRFMVAPILFAGTVVAVGKTTDGFIFAYPSAIKTDYAQAGHGVFDLPHAKKCFAQTGATSASDCSVGAVQSDHKAALWGDSHSYQLIDFFDRLGKKYDLSIHDFGFPMCPPIDTMPALPGDKSLMVPHLGCAAHDKAVMAYLLAHPEVKTVFMDAVWQIYSNGDPRADAVPQGHGFMPREIDEDLANTITKLEQAGKRVIVLDDVPSVPVELTSCEFYRDGWIQARKENCEYPASIAQADHQPALQILSRLTARFPNIPIVHTYDVLCSPTVCKMDLNGAPLYRYGDNGHLGIAGSELYFDEYERKHPGELEAIFATRG